VFHLAPTATRMHAHVMHASKPMGTSSSAPEQIATIYTFIWTFKIYLNEVLLLHVKRIKPRAIYALSIITVLMSTPNDSSSLMMSTFCIVSFR
jgi:hypothetical protein